MSIGAGGRPMLLAGSDQLEREPGLDHDDDERAAIREQRGRLSQCVLGGLRAVVPDQDRSGSIAHVVLDRCGVLGKAPIAAYSMGS